MNPLYRLAEKSEKMVIGLMSGTSADGVDAVLVAISGNGIETRVTQIAFESIPYEREFRANLLDLAGGTRGGSRELCLASFRLGQLFADAAQAVCAKGHVPVRSIDLIGSHGHTFYHIPQPVDYYGCRVAATLQLGEASLLNEAFGCPVVSDFRVRDMAAGGQGAPLVPYTEYLLYRSDTETIALQNIGGIGNITILPKGCTPDDVRAFDTGPGNMIIDALVDRFTSGEQTYDRDGGMANKGRCSEELLLELIASDAYLSLPPPKTTGREWYGKAFVDAVLERAKRLSLSPNDIIATMTAYTAQTIVRALHDYAPPCIDRLIVGGGGSHNPVLLSFLREGLSRCAVLRQEDLGLDSDSKEAVAFAVLANEAICQHTNSLPGVTGAAHPVVMGKISV